MSLKETDNFKLLKSIQEIKEFDLATYEHCCRVARIALNVAKYKGISGKDLETIGVAALLHDFGKTVIPKNILNKPDKLKGYELETMNSHAFLGSFLLKEHGIISDPRILKIIYFHNFDGKTDDDFIEIVKSADIYDALISDRPYKKTLSHQESIMEMQINPNLKKRLDLENVKILSIIENPNTLPQLRPVFI